MNIDAYLVAIFRIFDDYNMERHLGFNLFSSRDIHTRPTHDQCRPIFMAWSGMIGLKNYPLWLKSVSIPDQPPLYPRCIPDAPTLKSRSSRLTPPVLPVDQSPLCTTNPRPIPDANTPTTLNIGPTPDLISTPGLKWIIQANRQCYMGSVLEMRTWPILLVKSDLKWCIHHSRFTLTLRTVLVQYIEFCVVVCNFDDFVDRLVYIDVKINYKNYQESF